ncbi:hypothetical protein, partial [Cohnella sp. GbtcB17]|uniref:hypothetical protein n=1 Tax=Cohnella sp. GbtcB17 TaxID=2824762 RepID=UPI001C309D7A
YAVRKDRSVVYDKLVGIKGNSLILERGRGKQVQTKAIIPLVLFDLLAVGTAPFAYGGWGGGFGGGFGGWGGGWGGWW